MAVISHDKALDLIRKIILEGGSQYKAAAFLDISPAYLHDILNGQRSISEQVAKKLGYKRVLMYAELQK